MGQGWTRTGVAGDGPPSRALLESMALQREFESALGALWAEGLISGELHLGIGEEGVVAGVVDHLVDGDSMALDHRGTPPLVARGTDLRALLLEMLGDPDGLCQGQGGHMHLFDPDRSAASSGIVGASGPAACGFALAHQQQGTDGVAVAFFGEGATNQGMLLESFNLAVAWRLPVVFVCKDSRWAITTRSAQVTGGSLARRARGFGMPASVVDGGRPTQVWRAAGRAVARARRGRGPSFLLARVVRPRGHFEDDPLVRLAHDPREVLRESTALVAGAAGTRGTPAGDRIAGLVEVTRTLMTVIGGQVLSGHDPLEAVARRMPPDVVAEVRDTARRRVESAVAEALEKAEVPR